MQEPLEETVQILVTATQMYMGGNVRDAIEELSRGQLLAASKSDDAGVAMILVQKAGWLREIGRMDDGNKCLEQAQDGLSRVGPEMKRFILVLFLQEKGIFAKRGGDTKLAIRLLEQATAEAREDDHPLLSDVLANLSSALSEEGRIEEARTLLLEAIERDEKDGDARGISSGLNMLGILYLDSGDRTTAQLYFSRAAREASAAGMIKEYAGATHNYANTLIDAGRLVDARSALSTLRDLDKERGDLAGEASAISGLGTIAFQEGDLKEALELHLQAYRLHQEAGDVIHSVYDLVHLAYVEQRQDSSEAQVHGRRAVEEATKLGLLTILWAALYVEARSYLTGVKAGKNPEESLRIIREKVLPAYQKAADAAELLRTGIGRPEERQLFFWNKERIYEEALLLCGSVCRPRTAFEFSERARARAFLDTMGARRIAQRTADDPLIRLRQELTEYILNLDSTERNNAGILLDELRTVRAEIIAKTPRLASITEAGLPNLEAIASAIPEEGAVIEYYVGSSTGLTVFVLTSAGLRRMVTTGIKKSTLEGLVEQFRSESQHEVEGVPSGGLLQQILFSEILGDIQNVQRLTIIPHGCLNYVPFSALWLSAASDGRDRQYLCERFWLSVAPSAGFLPLVQSLSRPKFEKGSGMVLGNPTKDLPHAEREARIVAGYLGVDALLGEKATKAAVLKAKGPLGVLHIASHGEFSTLDPLLSGLILADGSLTVEEIMESSIPVGLLTLSGCVTGLSQRHPGEELIGLARAALAASIPSVIASLWNVDDASASVFFDGFYQHLSQGMPKDVALAATQRELLKSKEFSHPRHWAPFVLLGDWRA
jgi:CHAT domain-containing protein